MASVRLVLPGVQADEVVRADQEHHDVRLYVLSDEDEIHQVGGVRVVGHPEIQDLHPLRRGRVVHEVLDSARPRVFVLILVLSERDRVPEAGDPEQILSLGENLRLCGSVSEVVEIDSNVAVFNTLILPSREEPVPISLPHLLQAVPTEHPHEPPLGLLPRGHEPQAQFEKQAQDEHPGENPSDRRASELEFHRTRFVREVWMFRMR